MGREFTKPDFIFSSSLFTQIAIQIHNMNHYEGDENSVSTGVVHSGIDEGIDYYHRHLPKGLCDYGSRF